MSINFPFANPFGGERSALDLPVAGLAGLAVAFAMFTIPDDLLAEAVGATGIANFITAAQPPLGTTARIVLALAGSIGAFTGAFVLLRWLDRFALRAAPPVVIEERVEAPRIHKADAHPDAPPCRPISASRDLGEPAPPVRPASQPAPAAVPEAVPLATQSLSDLMARLERGLARREQAVVTTASVPAEPAVPPLPVLANDRLQSAIEGLRALSLRA